MGKNILIFSDGTGQFGGLRPDQRLSNIYKLYRATRVSPDNCIDPDQQIAFYDAGLGTSEANEPWYTAPISSAQKLFASATGSGIGRNIVDCYEQILSHYLEGDRIYLFGFSRGGYTVRCLANVIDLCGIPTTDANGKPLPRYGYRLRQIAEEAVYKVYDHEAGQVKYRDQYRSEQADLALRFRQKYGSDSAGQGNGSVYFVGAFDAVSSLGMKWWARALLLILLAGALAVASLGLGALASAIFGLSVWTATAVIFGISIGLTAFQAIRSVLKIYWPVPKGLFPKWHLGIRHFNRKEADSRFADCIQFARHALAIDETRSSFPRALWGKKDLDTEGEHPAFPRFRQMWFAGNHSDIGGSYPEAESRLSDIPLQWMLECVESLPEPIKVDHSKLRLFPRSDGMQHCEIEAMREKFPRWWPHKYRFAWREDVRLTASGAPHHPSVKERFDLPSVQQWHEEKPYRPRAFMKDPVYGDACTSANQDCAELDKQ